jgi:hypothetical protein|tara:strand:+ start:2603 stop:3082 length:480 start_codon:yes stop_codon:yes gene_type:complete
MQIARIKDNKVEEIGEHKVLFPNVGFPGGAPTESWMAENSIMPVVLFRRYNGLTEKSTVVDPYIEDGTVYLHKIETLDDSQKAAAQVARDNATAERHRETRNRLLAETDWMANSDVTMADAWKTYRQALRDLTKHSNWPNLKSPTPDGSGDNDWPVQPS